MNQDIETVSQLIDKNRYKIIKKLGEGTYGSVKQILNQEDGKHYAMKKIKFVGEDQGMPVHALRETAILKRLNHPNIVKIFFTNYNWQSNKLYFLMQYVAENLHENLKINFPLASSTIRIYVYQIIQGCLYLHENGVIHRDLKPQNILIGDDGLVKLCDFGQAKICNFEQYDHSEDISTLWYKAPQIILGAEGYDERVDMWAVGCILAELSQGYPLFRTNSQLGHIMAIFQRLGTPKLNSNCDLYKWKNFSPKFPKFEAYPLQVSNLCQNGLDLLRLMLQIDPKKRISAAQALKHNYFNGL